MLKELRKQIVNILKNAPLTIGEAAKLIGISRMSLSFFLNKEDFVPQVTTIREYKKFVKKYKKYSED